MRQDTAEYGQRIYSLAQLWRSGHTGRSGYVELNGWFQSFEGKELGPPIEFTVDVVEKRLRELLHKLITAMPIIPMLPHIRGISLIAIENYKLNCLQSFKYLT